MSTSLITIWHCDAQLCGATAPENTEGWTNAIYTHGCPDHGGIIAAHRAKLADSTRGRGSREKTTWYLHCACGWTPRPDWSHHTARPLHAQHLAHVHDQEPVEARPGLTLPEQWTQRCGSDGCTGHPQRDGTQP